MRQIINLPEFLSTNRYPTLGIGDCPDTNIKTLLIRQSPINNRFEVEKDITELFETKGFKKNPKPEEDGTALILQYSNEDFDEEIEVRLNDVSGLPYTTINVQSYEKETVRELEKELTQTQEETIQVIPNKQKTHKVPQHLFVTQQGYFEPRRNTKRTRHNPHENKNLQPHQYGAQRGH